VNLRTFLPPPATPTAPPPAVGTAAPDLPDGAPGGRPLVLAFLRHTGCPFAEWTARELRAAAERDPDVAWVAVSHAPAQATADWAEAVGGLGGATLLSDPERGSYAAWGLGRSSLGHFAGRRSLAQVAKLARTGVRNRHPHGTRWQRAGTFAVDAAGTVRWRHLPAHAGDLPDLRKAASVLK
jgi:AhpC/TSA family